MKAGLLMRKKLDNYIDKNVVCSDLIFRDWNEFLELLFECGGSVKEILWFEYVLIEKQKESLGGGGYQDANNPEYMWAETMIYDKHLEKKSLLELKEHIEHTIKSYQPHNLVPCFFEILT